MLFYCAVMITSAKHSSPYTSGRSLQEDLMWLRDANGDDYCHFSVEKSWPEKMRILSCPSAQADNVWTWCILSFPPLSDDALRVLSHISVKDLLNNYIPQDHGCMTPLQILAVHSASCLVTDRWDMFDVLKDIISALVTSDAHLHTGDHCQTPLLLFLSTLVGVQDLVWGITQAPRPRLLRRCLMWWLKTLQHGGVDLVRYGSKEEQTLQAFESLEDPIPPLQHWQDMFWWYFRDDIFHFKITYGPQPEDWTVQIDPPLEQYAWDFWQMTRLQHERQSLPMPGSWIDTQ